MEPEGFAGWGEGGLHFPFEESHMHVSAVNLLYPFNSQAQPQNLEKQKFFLPDKLQMKILDILG